MDEITRRNTETVKITLKSMLERVEQQQARIDGLHATISTLNSRLDEMQHTINTLRAKLSGSGPTSR